MPVDDHPIHPSTQKGDDFRYGCHNRKPFARGYYATDQVLAEVKTHGFHEKVFIPIAKFVPHKMSIDCCFDMSHTDPNCRGCKHVS